MTFWRPNLVVVAGNKTLCPLYRPRSKSNLVVFAAGRVHRVIESIAVTGAHSQEWQCHRIFSAVGLAVLDEGAVIQFCHSLA